MKFKMLKNNVFWRFSFSAVLAVCFLTSNNSVALAQSDELIKSAKTEASSAVSKILDLKNQNLDIKDKTKIEISLKKQSLSKIVEIMLLETKQSISNLEEIKDIDSKILEIRDGLVVFMNDYSIELSDLNKSLQDSQDLESLKIMTQKVSDIKEKSDKADKLSDDLSLFYENGKAVRIAEQRFSKISNQIKKMGINSKDAETIDIIMKDASKNIKEAGELVSEGAKYFLQESENFKDFIASGNGDILTTKGKEDKYIKTLAQTSLVKIKVAYKGFISISDIIK